MSRVYLIRHAKPSATWGGDDDDPGLDELGRAQARKAAEALLALPPEQRPTRVVSSPLRRCQETARPFAEAIGASLAAPGAAGGGLARARGGVQPLRRHQRGADRAGGRAAGDHPAAGPRLDLGVRAAGRHADADRTRPRGLDAGALR